MEGLQDSFTLYSHRSLLILKFLTLNRCGRTVASNKQGEYVDAAEVKAIKYGFVLLSLRLDLSVGRNIGYGRWDVGKNIRSWANTPNGYSKCTIRSSRVTLHHVDKLVLFLIGKMVWRKNLII